MKLPWRRKSIDYQSNIISDDFIACARKSLDAAQMDDQEIIHIVSEMKMLRLRNHFTQLFCGTLERKPSDYV